MNSSVAMKIDIMGRINKINIKKNEYLLPLFEAIVNSFQSLEESTNDNKWIKIILERNNDQYSLEKKEYNEYPFCNYIIEDNGVGFNEKNFDSFLTSDSTYKLSKGGKGIGRFVWLKAFKNINIQSSYEEDDNKYFRKFDFNIYGTDFIKSHEITICDKNTETSTKVSLTNIEKDYSKNISKDLNKIAKSIIYHCLDYFLGNSKIMVTLTDTVDTINLTKYVNDKLRKNVDTEDITINNYDFKIKHIKLYDLIYDKNKVHFCANDREVDSRYLNTLCNTIPDNLIDFNQKKFVYECYVSGEYLDKHVNDTRTGFDIEQNDKTIYSELPFKSIENGIVKQVNNYLNDFINVLNEEKLDSYTNYINMEQPAYRPLLKYKKDKVMELPFNLSKDKLDISLYKIVQELNAEIKEEGIKLKTIDIKGIENIEQYKEQLRLHIEKTNDLSKSSLADYIIHRKVVLDMLEEGLKLDDNSKYSKEEYIHNLIFPMRSTSDDIDYNKHNLWILDEKLSYHYYLASDVSLKGMEPFNIDSDKRPDLLIIDNPIAVIDNDTKPFNSIVIFEFKRPGRELYNDKLDPIQQLYNYVKQIRNNNAKDKNGRDIYVSENTMFYLYLICSRSKEVTELMTNYDFSPFPDQQGYYYFNKGLKSYIEVIYYDKLESDARKRNKILFDKLFTPQI
jgi:hypothetical protein